MGYSFDEDIFVIDCWIDTKEKEQTLLNLINRVKVYNCLLYTSDAADE